MSHATLKTPGSKSVVIVFPGPATLTFNAVFSDYNVAFGTDGSLTWSASLGARLRYGGGLDLTI